MILIFMVLGARAVISFPRRMDPPIQTEYFLSEGDHRPCSKHHEDQDHCSTREEVLRLDRRIHPCFPLHLPADVDLQAGIRRVWPIHCPQKVLLSILIVYYSEHL